MDREETGFYRIKAAHMHRLAEQAHNNAARLSYRSLEVAWLTLAQRSSELRQRFWSAPGSSEHPQDDPFDGSSNDSANDSGDGQNN